MRPAWNDYLTRVRQQADTEDRRHSVDAGRLRLVARAIERGDLDGARRLMEFVAPAVRDEIGAPPEQEES